MKKLVVDEIFAEWARQYGYFIPEPDMSVGVIDDDNIIGAAVFHAWSGPDIEVSYYGNKSLSLGVVRGLARIAVEAFGVSRVTARTARNNKTVTRGIRKLGFEYEGIRHCGYGDKDAVMYGLYGEKLAKLAGKAVH